MRLPKQEIILLMFTGLEYSMLPQSHTDIRLQLCTFISSCILWRGTHRFRKHTPEVLINRFKILRKNYLPLTKMLGALYLFQIWQVSALPCLCTSHSLVMLACLPLSISSLRVSPPQLAV